jgi:hypothetical protein
MRQPSYYFRNRSLSDFLLNRLAQWREPEVKIFFVGFNKSATSAVYTFLARQGIKSAHWRDGDTNLAQEIEKRLGHPAELKRYLDRWTAFSDLTLSSEERMIEGNRHFRLFHQLYPKAYFILNDRDPDRWVASRISHRRGQFAERSMRLRGCDIEELKEQWKAERATHNDAVLKYFAGSDRFLHFRVDQDDVSKLIDFLAPRFRLKPHHWSRENVSAKRWPGQ